MPALPPADVPETSPPDLRAVVLGAAAGAGSPDVAAPAERLYA